MSRDRRYDRCSLVEVREGSAEKKGKAFRNLHHLDVSLLPRLIF